MDTTPQSNPQGHILKRKRSAQQQPEAIRKKGRMAQRQIARVISAQTSGKAFGDGEMNVESFVGAQEFAIKALEDGMKNSKKSLSTRAFQNVPRDLRRRTASHNVKKVPKRLRARAAKEMKEDNTPTVTMKTRKKTGHMRLRLDTAKRLKNLGFKKKASSAKKDIVAEEAMSINGAPKHVKRVVTDIVMTREPRVKKNTLQKPPKPKAKFRKRQIHKAWLPTHLFHAKRAHMTPPKEPLWRMAIPLSPTAKCYRATHRASILRGGIAWDSSYMCTIGLEGVEKSVIGLLKALGVGKDEPHDFWDSRRATYWINGSRSYEGWAYERESWPIKAIAPLTVIWCAISKSIDPTAMEIEDPIKLKKEKRRIFIIVHPSAFPQLWEEVLRLSKIQKPAVMVEDLRYEIGSIEITGPGSAEILVGVLHPIKSSHRDLDAFENSEDVWQFLRNVTNPGSLPANAIFSMNVSDPRLHPCRKSENLKPEQDHEQQEQLLRILSSWPPDKSPVAAGIFDRKVRLAACRQLPSQKAINRRRTLAEPGQHPKPAPNDPVIPVMLTATRNSYGGQSTWKLLLPWRCVLPIWYSLMYCPLSTGGTLRFGGLDQKRQIAFETDTPWFPADYPGTRAGKDWESQEQKRRKLDWESRPKGKRVEFDSVKLGPDRKGEVGVGWACDWEKLMAKNEEEPIGRESGVYHLPVGIALQNIKNTTAADETTSADVEALVTVRISFLGRGVPTTCARVYRLPTDNDELRKRWLALHPKRNPKQKSNSASALARSSLGSGSLEVPTANDSNYPEVPLEQHLIGFITTGNFNLGEGKGTGLGSISLGKVVEYRKWKTVSHIGDQDEQLGCKVADEQFCVVREAGQAIGRLARWEIV